MLTPEENAKLDVYWSNKDVPDDVVREDMIDLYVKAYNEYPWRSSDCLTSAEIDEISSNRSMKTFPGEIKQIKHCAYQIRRNGITEEMLKELLARIENL